MLVAGVIVLCIASIIRAWGLLNYKRGPSAAAPIASKPVLVIVSTLSIILGVVGAILIGSETSFFVGLIVFVAFWFLSGIWISFLEVIGL
jgi:hypothetical protein